ncbi:MAG: UPF0158 family protein [Candidatus Hydrogenedentes bacterium]|nr:UPF0158 family protein [Candidatus Hydrogenedentota bacterium]
MPEYSELELAIDFVSGEPGGANLAVYDRVTDKILYRSDYSDIDEIPEDIDDERYVEIPDKRDLDLGRELVFRFAEQAMPDDIDLVYGFFRHAGAYSNFKNLVNHRNLLEQWHEFENAAMRKAIEEWCNENAIKLTGK